MTAAPAKRLKKLRTLDLSIWEVTFWLVKRKTSQREAAYSVLRVDIDEKLKLRFRRYFKQQVQGRDFHLSAPPTEMMCS